ncbi:hypothetical protein [Sinomonas mesophila]|uniref:hypothetical protein n=1 Tax=Sinomonas mesophila TaxID=1531955 RepID=UPI0009847BE1|nr:hypothetical protein [Sinomonas mesophila]
MTTTGALPTPITVFASSYLLVGVAVLTLISATGSIFAMPEFSYHSQRLDGEGASAATLLALILFTLLASVFTTLCLLLAYLNGRGSATGRVLTWVLGGLAMCFNIALLTVEVYEAVSWYRDLIRIVALMTLLFTLGGITLLALPRSHEYFRAARVRAAQAAGRGH